MKDLANILKDILVDRRKKLTGQDIAHITDSILKAETYEDTKANAMTEEEKRDAKNLVKEWLEGE